LSRVLFDPEGKKIEKFGIFRGNFANSNPNQRGLTLSDLSNKKSTRTHHRSNGVGIGVRTSE